MAGRECIKGILRIVRKVTLGKCLKFPLVISESSEEPCLSWQTAHLHWGEVWEGQILTDNVHWFCLWKPALEKTPGLHTVNTRFLSLSIHWSSQSRHVWVLQKRVRASKTHCAVYLLCYAMLSNFSRVRLCATP